MDATQSLYYGLGHVAYAVALADGKVQREEHKKIHDICVEGMKGLSSDLSVSEIIFSILEKEHMDAATTYKWGVDAVLLGSYKLTPEIEEAFFAVLGKIAEAFPPATDEELDYIEKFREDVKKLKHHA